MKRLQHFQNAAGVLFQAMEHASFMPGGRLLQICNAAVF
jgi:hypothetical protein